MARSKEVFVCSSCGGSSPKWQGQCAACGEWNTLVAELQGSGGAARGAVSAARASPSTSLAEEASAEQPRLLTGSAELDRVLGGGLVAGSVTLIGGDPGIGKSTLMLQSAAALSAGAPSLYATGEESLKQVGLRARRLGLDSAGTRLVAETQVEAIVEAAKSLKARALIVDSIQTMYSDRVDAAPGRRLAAARMYGRARAVREEQRHGRPAGGARDQGGADRRSARARAHGRHGALLRERHGQPLSGAALGQEPLRRGQRDRRVRDARAGLARSGQSFGDFPLAPRRAGVGQRHHRDARGHPFAVDRGASARRRQLGREPAPRRGRHRRQSPHHVARRGAPPRRTPAVGPGCVRQRGRRGATAGNLRGSRDRARGPIQLERQRPCRRR